MVTPYDHVMYTPRDVYAYIYHRVITRYAPIIKQQYSLVHSSAVYDAELFMPNLDFWFLMPRRDFHFRKKSEPEPSRYSS